jgi:hypothetical protein
MLGLRSLSATAILLFSVLLPAARVSAQSLSWSTPTKYDSGDQTSVSINSSGVIVEVTRVKAFSTTACGTTSDALTMER